ncbi:J domain-containing protein [bacterium]|nr:MAG: J domain-containing protein [bacterium]RIK64670.1 MAG: molecular chaperone DnaJ [Planctomycetota bacterium]
MTMKFQDYYEVLGVSRDAGEDEIKKAYTRLALKWHPDRHQGASRADAEAKFKQINEAKEVLLDPVKRRKYDQFGRHWEHGQDFTPPPGARARPVAPEEFAAVFGEGGFSDFFASMFGEDVLGRFGSSRAARAARARRGHDAHAELRLGIGQAIAGGKRSFELSTTASCPSCGGAGTLDDDHVCPACAGLGSVRKRQTVEVTLPHAIRDGMKLRLRGLGDPDDDGGEAGDLYLTLVLESDDTYRRRGPDIEADLPLAPWEALEGGPVEIRTLDGTATLNVPPDTASGARLRMRGLGLERDGRRGDFYAVVRLALPETLSERQKQLIREMKGGMVRGGARKA